MTTQAGSSIARAFKAIAKVEPHEAKAVILSFLYATLIFSSYSMMKPYRDAMGTVYGAKNLQELFTGTFFAMLVAAPVYSFFASRTKLSVFLPRIWGFLIVNILIFYALFQFAGQERWLAAVFYVWVSIFSLFMTSVFWSFMADMFSRNQAKRVFGFIITGFSLGGLIGPLIAATLIKVVGLNNVLLIAAACLGVAMVLVRLIEKEKVRVAQFEPVVERTSLDHKLGGNPFAGFSLILKSPYLMMLASFLMLMTWVSTVVYIQQAQLITNAFSSVEERTQVFAMIEIIVQSAAFVIQMVGTSRITQRFGIVTTLIVNPVLMTVGFIVLALSPVLSVMLTVAVIRRISEYALAKPGREMLFTIVDQESKYKAKNVIDTVVYRFGDVSSSWITAGFGMLGFGIPGTAMFGVAVCAVWGTFAVMLGRRYENVRSGDMVGKATPAPAQ